MAEEKPLVLLIDDNASLREILGVALKDMGCDVHEAPSAVDARKWLTENIPSLILVDIMMPDLNGLEFCRWVRGLARFTAVPIVVMSALKDEETVLDAMELGAVDFMRKPFPAKALKDKIGAVLAKRENN